MKELASRKMIDLFKTVGIEGVGKLDFFPFRQLIYL